MKPDNSIIKSGIPQKATVRALVQPGQGYAIYINGGSEAELVLALSRGVYKAEWVNTKTGEVEKTETFRYGGGDRTLRSPKYTDDIALRIQNMPTRGRIVW